MRLWSRDLAEGQSILSADIGRRMLYAVTSSPAVLRRYCIESGESQVLHLKIDGDIKHLTTLQQTRRLVCIDDTRLVLLTDSVCYLITAMLDSEVCEATELRDERLAVDCMVYRVGGWCVISPYGGKRDLAVLTRDGIDLDAISLPLGRTIRVVQGFFERMPCVTWSEDSQITIWSPELGVIDRVQCDHDIRSYAVSCNRVLIQSETGLLLYEGERSARSATKWLSTPLVGSPAEVLTGFANGCFLYREHDSTVCAIHAEGGGPHGSVCFAGVLKPSVVAGPHMAVVWSQETSQAHAFMLSTPCVNACSGARP